MPIPKPLDLTRFKRTNSGLIEFACLIEQAGPRRRDLIIKRVLFEDPDFLKKAMKKVVYFEELHLVDEAVLAELLDKLSSKTLAYALKGSGKDFRKFILDHLPYPKMKAVLDEEKSMLENSSPTFIKGAQKSILKIARDMEAQGKFIFEVLDCPRFRTKKWTP